MKIPYEFVELWRDRLLNTPETAQRELSKLLSGDRHAYYIELLGVLASDSDTRIQRASLLRLSYYGDPNDAKMEKIALSHTNNPDPRVRDAAFAALGRIATPETFTFLFSMAEQENAVALRAATKQIRSPEQKEKVVDLARRLILSDSFRVVWQALYVLRQFSTAEAEEDILLQALDKDPSDIIISALGHARPRVLPVLKEFLVKYPKNSVQYIEAERAINLLRQKYPNS